jgi:DNA segregation ATPase FtsK/SpoIIIE-like protein
VILDKNNANVNDHIKLQKFRLKFGISLIVISVLVLFCLFARNSFFIAESLANFVMGLFGIISYPLCLVLGLYGYCMIKDKRLVISKGKLCLLAISIFSLIMFMHIISTYSLYGDGIGFNEHLSKTYEMQTSLAGALFGIPSFGLASLVGTILSLLILFVAFAISTWIFTDYGKQIPFLKSKKRVQRVEKKAQIPFVKGTVDSAQLVSSNPQNSLFVETIIPRKTVNLSTNQQLSQIAESSENTQSDRFYDLQSTPYAQHMYNYQSASPQYNSAQQSNYTSQFESENIKSSQRANSLDDSDLNSRSAAYMTLFGNPNPLKSSRNLNTSVYNANNYSASPPQLFGSNSPVTVFKPPKLTSPKKTLKSFVFPPSPDIEQEYVSGEIINGDDMTKRCEKDGKATSILDNLSVSKRDKKKYGSPIDRAFSQIDNDTKKTLSNFELDLPPITNGEQVKVLANKKTEKSKVTSENASHDNSNSGFVQPEIINASMFTKNSVTNQNSDTDLFASKYKDLNNGDIIDDIFGDLIVEDEPKAEYTKKGELDTETLCSEIFDNVIDFVSGEDHNIEDHTGYYTIQHQDQNTSNIFDGQVDVNQNISLDKRGNTQQLEFNVSKRAVHQKKRNRKYVKPNINLLSNNSTDPLEYGADSQLKAEILIKTLHSFGLEATIKDIAYGPAVTRFEIEMPPGVPIKKIEQYTHDLAYNLESSGGIRIEMPIPGKKAIGIEVPNSQIGVVGLKDIIDSKEFKNSVSPLTLALGKDISGQLIVASLEKMPHLLIAGATNSGKSACLNAIITSILYKASPEEVRLILIDPKRVEFSVFANLPHLIVKDIVTESAQAINAFNWAINEMERRYKLMQVNKVKNIVEFNFCEAVQSGSEKKLPYVVIIVDELADLMLTNKREVEDKIRSLTQKARAAGIHLIIATQRPSVDVITGTIKANLPSRIAFSVTQYVDSKTILDTGGAENLLGRGDMLYSPIDNNTPKRVQGAYITSAEVLAVVEHCKSNNDGDFDERVEKEIMTEKETNGLDSDDLDSDAIDPLLPDVLRRVIESGQASTSMIQRRFSVGYARASRIVDQMEQRGYIGPLDGSKPREVRIAKDEFIAIFGESKD